MRRLLLLPALLAAGCVYLNTLYNGEEAWERAERARLSGRGGESALEYARALEKAEESFRRDSTGGWAARSLLLSGQARVRLGEPAAGLAELDRVLERTDDPVLRRRANLYRGAALFRLGHPVQATEALNLALFDTPETDELAGEAHLWRGRVLLARGLEDQAWWDLEQAAAAPGRLDVPVRLETLAWAAARGDTARARRSAEALFRDPRGAPWADSILVLADRSRAVAGPGPTARILAAAAASAWPSEVVGAVRIREAAYRRESADEAGATRVLAAVANHGGQRGLEARRELARMGLARARTPGDLSAVREVLLPAAGDSAVAGRLARVRAVELLAGTGRYPPLFAAGEIARDELAAPGLAHTLFLRAAALPDAGPWRGKALLAARTLSRGAGPQEAFPGEEVEARLFTLLLRDGDPYLTRARNRYLATDTLAVLDGALELLLEEVRTRAREEAGRRDVGARGTGGPE